MTLTTKECILLLQAHKDHHQATLDNAIKEVAAYEKRVNELNTYIEKENYHIDKFLKAMETIQRTDKSSKSFLDIHKSFENKFKISTTPEAD